MGTLITAKIETLLERAEKLVWFEIEREVKKVLQDPKIPATGFITAMGGYFWIAGGGEEKDFYLRDDLEDDERRYPWQKPINAVYDNYNEIFKMHGAGVRWDLIDGKVIKSTDW